MLRIDERDDGVEEVVVADLLVGEERLRHRPGVGHAGGLDHHAVELEITLVALLLQRAEDADEIAAHRAADAAVVHLDDLLVARLEDVVVDPDLAELVLDHRDAVAVVFLEYPVKQRGLAAAEEAGEDRHRHHLLFGGNLLRHACSLRRENFTRLRSGDSALGQTRGQTPGQAPAALRDQLPAADRQPNLRKLGFAQHAINERAVRAGAFRVGSSEGVIYRMRRNDSARPTPCVDTIAGPWMLTWPANHLRADRVLLYVAVAIEEIAFRMHYERVVATIP